MAESVGIKARSTRATANPSSTPPGGMTWCGNGSADQAQMRTTQKRQSNGLFAFVLSFGQPAGWDLHQQRRLDDGPRLRALLIERRGLGGPHCCRHGAGGALLLQ